ncbi:MAG: hypothetical protein A2W31_00060 [Planctomycetes bacterium RBG_16_64_10]|nr:MAG: hypothetical protein A2W31_00060 [Planctomycetes bacterium RBG_16_64_10]
MHEPAARAAVPWRRRWHDLKWRLREKYVARYTFVHINKTGGSSIESALGLPFRHMTAREMQALVGPQRWQRRFTFTVVRNPWAKVVSHYGYRLKRDKLCRDGDRLGFADWVRLAYGQNDPRYYDVPKMFMPQVDWITDDHGAMLVDFVGRFEDLEGSFAEICRRLGVVATLPHLKRTDHGPYQEYYTPEARGIVARWFARDIEQFGYGFG